MADLAELLKRVKAATGPDVELDGRIWCAVNGYEFVRVEPWATGHRVGYKGGPAHWYYTQPTEPLTRSLDAALALVERYRSPLHCYGWQVELDDEPVHHPYYAHIAVSTRSPAYGKGAGRNGVFTEDGESAPLALLAALLSALAAADVGSAYPKS